MKTCVELSSCSLHNTSSGEASLNFYKALDMMHGTLYLLLKLFILSMKERSRFLFVVVKSTNKYLSTSLAKNL